MDRMAGNKRPRSVKGGLAIVRNEEADSEDRARDALQPGNGSQDQAGGGKGDNGAILPEAAALTPTYERVPLPQYWMYQRLGHCCVYVVGPPKARPVKVGMATDIFKRVEALQVSHWHELRVHWLAWTSSSHWAHQVEQRTHEIMAANRIRGEWFDVPEALARESIFAAASQLRIKLYSHKWLVQKIGYLADKAERKETSRPFYTGKLAGGA